MTPDDLKLNILSASSKEGKISAQVADSYLFIKPPTDEEIKEVEDAEAMHDTLINDGLLAWKVASPTSGMPKVIYTPHARNPATKRLVSAYLWMTPLAVIQYGDDLYQMYQQTLKDHNEKYHDDQEIPEKETFITKLLRDTVPVAPTFRSQVPPDILARCVKPKKKTVPVRLDATGHVEVLGPRKVKELLNHQEPTGQALLETLEQWKVGPHTRLSEENTPKAVRESRANLEQIIMRKAGLDGINWMVKQGFQPRFEWFRFAFANRQWELLDSIEALGVDPKTYDKHGSLWHSHAWAGDWNPKTSQWLISRQVDWNIPDHMGNLPLARLLNAINSKTSMRDDFGSVSGRPLMQSLMTVFPNLRKENRKEEDQIKQMEDLAIEMVRSGVSLTYETKEGTTPLMSLFPGQTKAFELMKEKVDPTSKTPDEDAFRALMFGDTETLRRDPNAYGKQQLAFIERLEEASGLTLLDREPDDAAKKKGAKP